MNIEGINITLINMDQTLTNQHFYEKGQQS